MKCEYFKTLSENNRIRIRVVRPPRGVTLDRRGGPIAETQGSFDLIATPVDIQDLAEGLRLLGEVVEFDPEEISGKIILERKTNPFRGLTGARDLRFEQVSVDEFNRESLPGFSIMVEAKRSYPFGPEFAHILGYVGEASEQEIAAGRGGGLSSGDIVGKYGLGETMGAVLRGVNG